MVDSADINNRMQRMQRGYITVYVLAASLSTHNLQRSMNESAESDTSKHCVDIRVLKKENLICFSKQ